MVSKMMRKRHALCRDLCLWGVLPQPLSSGHGLANGEVFLFAEIQIFRESIIPIELHMTLLTILLDIRYLHSRPENLVSRL